MSYSACYTIECDEPGCDSIYFSTSDYLGEALKQASSAGWDTEGEDQFCNKHGRA